MPILYLLPGAASFTPHLLMRELGLTFDLRLVDRAAGEHRQPDYLKLNPNGLVPVLVDGSLVLYETAAIVLHLVDQAPAAGLAPPVGSAARAEFYKWLVWMSSSLQPAAGQYFYPERALVPGSGAAAEVKAQAEARVASLFDQVESHLAATGGPWMLGASYSALDPYVFMLGRWTRNMSRPARTLPHVGPFLQRMLERPAVQATFAAEGLSAPWV